MNELNNKIKETFKILKEWPLMIITKEVTYPTLQCYLEGYVDGLAHVFKKNLRLEISQWFQKRINQKASVFWTNHIIDFYKGKTDEELQMILINTTEEYFQENPEWYKS